MLHIVSKFNTVFNVYFLKQHLLVILDREKAHSKLVSDLLVCITFRNKDGNICLTGSHIFLLLLWMIGSSLDEGSVFLPKYLKFDSMKFLRFCGAIIQHEIEITFGCHFKSEIFITNHHILIRLASYPILNYKTVGKRIT